MEIIIGFIVCCAAAWLLGRLTRKTKPPIEEFAYSNVLDQIKEDDRIDGFIDSALYAATDQFKFLKYGISGYDLVIKNPNYKIFDLYTAKYKDVDIEGLIRQKFNNLINEKMDS